MPFLPPNQQRQSTEGNNSIAVKITCSQEILAVKYTAIFQNISVKIPNFKPKIPFKCPKFKKANNNSRINSQTLVPSVL